MNDTKTNDDNWFDHKGENAVHDAWLMIESDKTDYDSIEDVLVGETIFTEDTIEYWRNSDRL